MPATAMRAMRRANATQPTSSTLSRAAALSCAIAVTRLFRRRFECVRLRAIGGEDGGSIGDAARPLIGHRLRDFSPAREFLRRQRVGRFDLALAREIVEQ